MSSFTANSQEFNVVTENELAVVLSHYNSEFVLNIIEDAMKKRFQVVPITATPNVVSAWEQNFRVIMARYGAESHEEVLRVRNETYREIIDRICREFGLNFTIDDSIDLFSAASHLYDLLVCNFTANMTTFFANFIYRERASLYDNLGLSELRKSKDSSTAYGKKIYKDIKLAVINANIDAVVSAVCQIDIPFFNVISTIYGNNSEMKKFILSIVAPIGDGTDFMKNAYIPVLASDVRPDIITAIRFVLQEISIAHDQTMPTADLVTGNNVGI